MTTIEGAVPAPVDLTGDRRRRRREQRVRAIFLAAALSSIVISIAIVVSLIGSAVDFLTTVDLGSLWSDGWFPRRDTYDIKTLLVGTLLVTLVAMVVATPLGLATAVYLSEYAPTRMRKIVKPVIEVLAGIPSIVLGFFALTWISPNIVELIWPGAESFNLAAAGIGVGILVIPIIASISEDAMTSVPRALREASYGLGAKKVQTSLRVVFPAAISGIVASIIIGISRAIGETMVVAIAAGGTGGVLFTTSLDKQGQTITAAMASLATGTDQVAGGAGSEASLAFNSLFFLGLLLFVITLSLNLFGDVFVRRIRKEY